LEQDTVNAIWGNRFTWEELSTLAICLALDLLDYLVPFMMTPIYGDLLDLIGLIFAFMYFNWQHQQGEKEKDHGSTGAVALI